MSKHVSPTPIPVVSEGSPKKGPVSSPLGKVSTSHCLGDTNNVSEPVSSPDSSPGTTHEVVHSSSPIKQKDNLLARLAPYNKPGLTEGNVIGRSIGVEDTQGNHISEPRRSHRRKAPREIYDATSGTFKTIP